MKSSAKKIELASVDDLFSTEEGRQDAKLEKIQEIPLSELHPFRNHPFKVKDDEAMMETADSIKQYGVLVPAIARPDPEGGYELVAGHRRHRASELAGKETMPVIVRDLDDDAATIIMVDSNLQRESLLPSERAFAYKMKLDAMKRQAGRPSKENVSQVGTQKRSDQLLAEQVGQSRNQIQRYFGGDILSTMLNKLRRKPKQDDPFDFSLDTVTVSLSIDSIRQLYSGDAAEFVEEKILPNAEKTMAVLTEQEQTATRLLLSALIGFLAAEAPMDEQSFPLMMELLNCMEGEKEDGCQDAVDSLLEDAACNTRRHEEYYSNYQRYQLMQVDKTRVILACRIIINDLLGKLYRYDYRFGYNLLLDEENSIEKKLHTPVREEWEAEDDEI